MIKTKKAQRSKSEVCEKQFSNFMFKDAEKVSSREKEEPPAPAALHPTLLLLACRSAFSFPVPEQQSSGDEGPFSFCKC